MESVLSSENRETLVIFQRALEMIEGFALYFVRSNLPLQNEALLAQLSTALGSTRPIFRVNLGPRDPILPHLLAEAARVPPGGSLHVFGLELQLPPNEAQPNVLQQLNLSREHFRRLACPVVFWLREEALTRLAQGAPDFWAWRSGVFEFLPEPGWVGEQHIQHVGQGTLAWRDLPPQEKSARILALEGLLEDYRLLEQNEHTRRAQAEVALELGKLYLVAYRIEESALVLEQALTLYRAVGDRLGEANVLKARGDVQAFRKENDAALDSYAQALTLYRAVGAKVGEANTHLSLGDIYKETGNIENAQYKLKNALDLYSSIGDRYSQARALYRLGDCAFETQNYDLAISLYEQAMTLWQAIQLDDLVNSILIPRLKRALAEQQTASEDTP